MPVDQACRLADVDVTDFKEELLAVLRCYPEADAQHKYIHFMIYERAMRWLFEGENHNRCYFWSVTPFYALDFFRAAMSARNDLKRGHRLYAAFLTHLDAGLAAINDAKRGRPVNSSGYIRRQDVIELLNRYTGIAARLRRLRGAPVGYQSDHAVVRLIESLAGADENVKAAMNDKALTSLSQDIRPLDRATIDNILTVLLAVSLHGPDATDVSSLESLPL
jgi:asparagine synthase (glutamine-hydrolysing)